MMIEMTEENENDELLNSSSANPVSHRENILT